MKKFIKSMLLLFVAATVTHTPAFGQLSYSLPPLDKQLSRSVQPQETKKVRPTYSLPNYEMKNNNNLRDVPLIGFFFQVLVDIFVMNLSTHHNPFFLTMNKFEFPLILIIIIIITSQKSNADKMTLHKTV